MEKKIERLANQRLWGKMSLRLSVEHSPISIQENCFQQHLQQQQQKTVVNAFYWIFLLRERPLRSKIDLTSNVRMTLLNLTRK